MAEPKPGSVERSTLDRGELREQLEHWLRAKLPTSEAVSIPELDSPESNGMSSETLLFELQRGSPGARDTLPLVARLAPDPRDVPIFPTYDLSSQFRLLQIVSEAGVPAPGVRWIETDAEALGTPFFVMDRIEGRVPPDIPPYPFAGWVLDASEAQQDRLQQSTLDAIAALHAIDHDKAGADFLHFDVMGDTPLRRHFQNQRDYYAWTSSDGVRHPVIERAFDWLESHWPAREGEASISWGDSRIGNVLYDGFEPAALLDWEMAGIGPRELDLGWLCFMHRFFQDIAVGSGLAGLPEFLRLADVAARYEKISGYAPRDLGWYYTYAALRHAIIMARIHRRTVHFGQSQWEDDADAIIPHRMLLERLLEGRFDPLAG